MTGQVLPSPTPMENAAQSGSGQAADAIQFENVVSMVSSLNSECYKWAAWPASVTTLPQLIEEFAI